MDEWITKAEILEMGMTEGQYKWRVLTGDIKRHPESKRLYSRYDVERLVKCGRSAQKPFGSRPAREEMPKRGKALKASDDEIKRQASITKLRARLALHICSQLMEHDTKLGRQVRGLFRTTPERVLETANALK